jgi:hypothetical protein
LVFPCLTELDLSPSDKRASFRFLVLLLSSCTRPQARPSSPSSSRVQALWCRATNLRFSPEFVGQTVSCVHCDSQRKHKEARLTDLAAILLHCIKLHCRPRSGTWSHFRTHDQQSTALCGPSATEPKTRSAHSRPFSSLGHFPFDDHRSLKSSLKQDRHLQTGSVLDTMVNRQSSHHHFKSASTSSDRNTQAFSCISQARPSPKLSPSYLTAVKLSV